MAIDAFRLRVDLAFALALANIEEAVDARCDLALADDSLAEFARRSIGQRTRFIAAQAGRDLRSASRWWGVWRV